MPEPVKTTHKDGRRIDTDAAPSAERARQDVRDPAGRVIGHVRLLAFDGWRVWHAHVAGAGVIRTRSTGHISLFSTAADAAEAVRLAAPPVRCRT